MVDGKKKSHGPVTVVIAVGRRKPPHGLKKGPNMIKVPLDALEAETDEGDGVTPEMGDAVELEAVEGTVRGIEDGHAHVELTTAGGHPIEYVEMMDEEEAPTEKGPSDDDMDKMEKLLMKEAERMDGEASY
jgi:hypothetical protein